MRRMFSFLIGVLVGALVGSMVALLMTPPAATDQVVRECADAGVRQVWMHRGGGAGAVSPEAVVFCRERGIEVVDGECPFMFLPGTSWFHGVHRFFKRLGGRLPS